MPRHSSACLEIFVPRHPPGWAEHVARTLHTRWALEVEAVMLFAYGHGGAASPLVQKHLAASPYLALFRSHYLSSPFDASRRLSPPHSRLVVRLAKGLTHFRTVRIVFNSFNFVLLISQITLPLFHRIFYSISQFLQVIRLYKSGTCILMIHPFSFFLKIN